MTTIWGSGKASLVRGCRLPGFSAILANVIETYKCFAPRISRLFRTAQVSYDISERLSQRHPPGLYFV